MFYKRTASLESLAHSPPLSTRSWQLPGGQSDAESREGLHQGDLGAGVRLAPAAVPAAAPALQGLVTLPLLLSLLPLQSLLFSPLFVRDLKEETAT